MIAFRYTKLEGAEFISHLDTLRHLNKIFLRAGIKTGKSQGFHPHPLVFMASPLGVGIKSVAEYCAVETDVPADEFITMFNGAAPRGIKCNFATETNKNPNFAAVIDSAKYFFDGMVFPCESVLSRESFLVETRGEKKEARGKIISLTAREGGTEAVLAAGNSCLRSDAFASAIRAEFGGGYFSVCKLESYVGGVPACNFAASMNK